eukprot:912715-Heterocapsa_arctica.AAC.1
MRPAGLAGRQPHPVGFLDRTSSSGRSDHQRSVRVRGLTIMQASLPAGRLRLVERACPDPFDATLSKR